MKKIYSLVLMSLVTVNLFAARIPVGSVVYLDVSQEWCCRATYAVCTNENGSNAARVMQKVADKEGVYSFTVPQKMATYGGLQDNFRFGYSDTRYTRDQGSWESFYTKQPSGNWSEDKPYYIVTDETGGGYWAAQPVSSGVTELDSVVVSTPFSCIDSTYDVMVSVYFKGAPCSIKLTGDQWPSGYHTTSIRKPLVVQLKGIKEEEGTQHSVSVTLYRDKNSSDVIATETKNYVSPTLDCEEEYDLGDQCTNEELELSTEVEGEVYKWSTGETTQSITVTPVMGEQTYTVEVYNPVLQPEQNLMANGDFESDPPIGFTSDYKYVGWDPSGYYSDHGGESNLYAITKNAAIFWSDFASIKPHGGEYFALFDADQHGYAWKATTDNNPNLKIQKDSVYLFSYWAAYPNKSKGNNPAILEFEIKYKDAEGVMHEQKLGQQYKLGQEEELNAWYQQTVSWKAPCDANYVEIAVKDVNNTTEYIGNDFCLDDIMFQQASVRNMRLAFREIFHVNGIDCETPTPPDPPVDPECDDNWLRTKWNDVIFVDNSAGEFVRYQWLVNGEEIEGATEQFYQAPQSISGSEDLYQAKMWKADGTYILSCPKTFGEINRSNTEYPYRPAQVQARRVHIIGSHFRIIETIYEDGKVEAVKEVY